MRARRTRSTLVAAGASLTLAAALVAVGCGSGATVTTGGTGGAVATGGATATGGNGGASGTGGATTGTGGTATGGVSGGAGRGGAGGSGQGGKGGASSGGAPGTAGAAGAGAAGGTGGKAGAPGTGGAAGATGSCASPATYDQTVLCDQPVAYWAMKGTAATEPDLVANNVGTYKGAAPTAATLPNGDAAAHFNGSTGYLTIPSNAAFSLPTTHDLTWEGWINADTLQFPNSSDGYVDWMGKCADYSPTCEWEARMYSTSNSESRPNRMSAYIFNSSAGLGSAADWQPVDGLIKASTWYHVVGEYTTLSQPSDCTGTASYPGSINVWVNGVEWDHAQHGQTGCMSQYNVVPTANNSPLNIGTMAGDTWFPGAVGKVAIYDKLLTPAQITAHYKAMTGKTPTGSCAATCSF